MSPIDTSLGFSSPFFTGVSQVSQLAQSGDVSGDVNTAVGAPSFLDVFRNVLDNAVETNEQKDLDAIALAVGETDNIEEITANIQKAQIATELLVAVKNAAYSAYSEIVKMQM